MAYRIHVTALRDSPADQVRATFTEILGPAFQNVEIHEHGGWTWFMTSVWGVSAGDLNKGLCQLARPSLQFTTSDAWRWYLTIHGGPQGQRHFLHEFGDFSAPIDPSRDKEMEENARYDDDDEAIDPDLAFLEDEASEAPKGPGTVADVVAENFKDWNADLPEELVESMRDLPYSQVMTRLRDWYVQALPEALKEAGIPNHAGNLRKVLLWEEVTPGEHDSDIGNLPRLLSTLGLGGQWDNFVREAEQAQTEGKVDDSADEEEPDPREPQVDHAQQVFDRVRDLPLADVEGGAVPLGTKHLARAGLPSEACSTGPSPTMAVILSLPASKRKRSIELPETVSDYVQVDATDEKTLRFGLLNRVWSNKEDLQDELGKPLTKLLLQPPEGTLIEAAFAVADQPATYQRFRGAVREGSWRVEQSYPPLSHETLADAFEVAAFEKKDKATCRDEAEAVALEQAARRDQFLSGMGVKRKGKVVSVEFDTGNLAKLLLRLRYPDAPWDFGPVEAERAQEYQERIVAERSMRRKLVEASRQRAAPHDSEVLLKGRHSVYWKSDFQLFKELDQEPRQKFDQIMQTLGFSYVGDLVVKKQRDVMTRLFLSGDRRSYGLIMAKKTMYLGVEFVSRLEDGSGLTTTTNAMVESNPKAGIYYRDFPGLTPEALHEKHLEGLKRFRVRKQLKAVELEGTLEGVAREIEIAFGRQQQVVEDD